MTVHGRSLATVAAVALALAAPSAAGAACVPRSIDQLVREAPVVVTAKAQPGALARNGVGLLSPATFKVAAYDQGSGPQELKVRTALTEGPGGLVAASDGVNPMAGQTWHLWGSLGADGVFQTSVCLGSVLVGAQQAPALSAGDRRTALRAASLAGVPRGGTLPTVTVPRNGKAVLQLSAREANFPVSPAAAKTIVAVRITRGATTTSHPARWSARDGVLSTKLAAPASGTATVVVITRAAAYAARLRAG